MRPSDAADQTGQAVVRERADWLDFDAAAGDAIFGTVAVSNTSPLPGDRALPQVISDIAGSAYGLKHVTESRIDALQEVVRDVQAATGRRYVISFWPRPFLDADVASSPAPELGIVYVPPPHPVLFTDSRSSRSSDAEVIAQRHLRSTIEWLEPSNVAGVIGEPGPLGLAGHGADHLHWKTIAETCAEYGLALIADESRTSIGRTGEWLAALEGDIRPDVLVLDSSLTAGAAPFKSVWCAQDSDLDTDSPPEIDPDVTKLALRTLACVDRLLVAGTIADLGRELDRRLQSLFVQHASVIDTHARGLLGVIEFEPFRFADHRLQSAFRQRIYAALVEEQLRVQHTPFALVLTPSYVVTESDIEAAMARLDRAITDAERRFG